MNNTAAPRKDKILPRHATIRWILTRRVRATGAPVNLTGYSFSLYIQPLDGTPPLTEIVIDEAGPADKKITVDAAAGKITILISQTQADLLLLFDRATYRLEQTDTSGDTVPLVVGMFTFDQLWG